MNVVSFGGGTNSTAMIIGMYLHKIPIDLILFADTGGEQPHTYEFMETFNEWLMAHGIPKIISVEYRDRNGNRLTLEQECINSGRLPSIAYGFKKCSLKHKIGTQEKFCNNYQPCKEVWASGQRVHKYIGYDAGEKFLLFLPINEEERNPSAVGELPRSIPACYRHRARCGSHAKNSQGAGAKLVMGELLQRVYASKGADGSPNHI